MSGVLALLDDVAAIAKVAAASIDDVAAHTAKAGSKAAGIVIDDAAVTPKYVTGFKPERELPMIWRIAKGSLINKLVFLLPVALLMSLFAPWLVPPLLILGGGYLCFEGAEKIMHVLKPHAHVEEQHADTSMDVQALEEKQVKGAIKTDFILSAEIMTLTLSTIESDNIWMQAVVLAVVGIVITFAVYGVVAIIVKMDDLGLWLARVGKSVAVKSFGRAIVAVMPWFLKVLTVVGTAAMLWVGGSIIVHSAHQMGWHFPEETIHHWAHGIGQGDAAFEWISKAVIDGVLGVFVGLALVPVVTKVIAPLLGGKKGGAH